MSCKKTRKFKISAKLTLYFTISILLFAIVIGTVFALLFREHTEEIYRENMKQTASSISKIMESVIRENEGSTLWEAFSEKGEVTI